MDSLRGEGQKECVSKEGAMESAPKKSAFEVAIVQFIQSALSCLSTCHVLMFEDHALAG